MLVKTHGGGLSGLRALFSRMTGPGAPRLVINPEAQRCWEKEMPLSAQTFMAVATAGLNIRKMTITFTGDHFDAKITGKKFEDKYPLYSQYDYVGPGYLISERNDRFSGRLALGRRFAAAACLGYTHATINASHMMGAYMWARMGAHLHDNDVPTIRDAILTRLCLLEGTQPEAVIDFVKSKAELEKPDDLRSIAELPMMVGDSPLWRFSRALEDTHAFCDVAGYRRQRFVDQDLSLGKFLLAGLSYYADVFFWDHAQMDIVENRTHVPVRALAHQHGVRLQNPPVRPLARQQLPPHAPKLAYNGVKPLKP